MADPVTSFAPLPRSFYEPSARTVARQLLGHWLIRRTPDGPAGGLIVETEAYLIGDAACHAAPGLTPRNRVMFGAAGHAYIYFIYGCHYCFNAVCRPAGMAEAVLVRAVEPLLGLPFMGQRRPMANEHRLTNGPGKLCAALEITGALNGVDLCDPASELMIAQNENRRAFRRQRGPLLTTVRVGLTKAADLPLRFYLPYSSFVSRH